MANASLRLFANAQLSLDGRVVHLLAATHGEEDTLQFSVSPEDAAWLASLQGRMGIAQTPRGVVLTRVHLVEVDLKGSRIRLRPSDRSRAGRVELCAVARLAAHRHR